VIDEAHNLYTPETTSQLQAAVRYRIKIFGFAPSPLLSMAPGFRQGEALFAGGFAPVAMTVRVRKRPTQEGGATSAYPCVSGQPSVIPSVADDGVMSGKRLMRKEFSKPSRPAMIGTNRAI
jgi:hypothetical protein